MELKAGMTSAVVGAGYLGRRAARLLRERGCSVITTAVSDASLESLRRKGFDARRLDLESPETFSVIADATAVVLCPAPSDSSEDGYRRLYGEGIPRLAAYLAARPQPPRVVYTSSSSVYREASGEWVDESGAVDRERAKPAALLTAEDAVLAPPLAGVVLRLAGIYGPERNRIAALLSGTLQLPPAGEVANQIHIDDAAKAAIFLLERGAPGEIYLGVDSAPTPRAEFYAWLAEKVGTHAPAPGDASAGGRGGNKQCSNKKLLGLGFTFSHPSFRDGYRDLVAAHTALQAG